MVKAWKETVTIPTYEVGKPEKNPIFLENRVYQGSSGKVYPYPVIEAIADEKHDREWNAVFIENEYIKVMILPELGGRVQMAYDKIKKRHFVYYNQVIKPALVGLTGPWISGGIEFNWPQHHRPSTYMEVDCTIENNADGSVTVWVNEMEQMTHQKGMAGFTLRPGCAYLEIKGKLYNRTDVPQTFLWWANPAVSVNEAYRSVFPPDINAVFDHGKRAVSSFPIATGTYYKIDYSAGVDIANYRNIPVPTSYMGVNSAYDFEGGYECDTQAGMLHVASHHVSPGKKQWTWGNGDFGQAWDRNLTDEDGPYIELMAGVFTENQPDFSWLMPYEEKEFTQYFMPYRELGMVKNASKDVMFNIEESMPGKAVLKIYATSRIEVSYKVEGESLSVEGKTEVSPENVVSIEIDLQGASADELSVELTYGAYGRLSYVPNLDDLRPIPDAAEPAKHPEDIKTNEQLYLTGLHLEQYRHATFSPLDYYEEALRRDPDDYRCNNAMGLWYIRACLFEKAEKYLRKAVRTILRRNPNPYDGEPIYNLALALKYQGKSAEAYELFHKATWNAAWQEAAFYEAACLAPNPEEALYETERAIRRNAHHHKARALRAALLRRLNRVDEALELCRESIAIDPFNYGARWVEILCRKDKNTEAEFAKLIRRNSHNYDETALDFAAAGMHAEAIALWDVADKFDAQSLMSLYYKAWVYTLSGSEDKAIEVLKVAETMSTDFVFPNRPEAVLALENAIRLNPDDANANHILGCLYYAKGQHAEAFGNWCEASAKNPENPTTWRNLALVYHNKQNNTAMALDCMKQAFSLDKSDARIFMEYDQLIKVGTPQNAQARLDMLADNMEIVMQRDDLLLEYITLLNFTGRYSEAISTLDGHKFHPWEGGEGKVSTQYQFARVSLAIELMNRGDYGDALKLLEQCLEYPHHLGEGKLHGAQENDFYLLIGICHEALGNESAAQEAYIKATEGPTEPAAAMYYNDAKPDKIFYAGLAYRALGNDDMARSYFHRLVNYGKQHIHDNVRMDYFAVSLPDLLIWNGDLNKANRLHCLYMLALGYTGLGDDKRAQKYLAEAKEMSTYHVGLESFEKFLSLV